ncbi:hypothetical protein NADFUDRAFT_47355 [Nadsonia fulvescens var. elongata DSM 6958]|uniref:Mannosyltransferase n=1 Tax=Nadsonia fulvescens var. elongata DSM 6958 TaxID=857566 RepID=A0A1E3PH77_9ASCO|nr:hypothetical protein NADFUDRAFT_47355 [Nadsonia fulvescens var. elongata DSM 6958]
MKTWKVFSFLLVIRLICAQYSIIPDCDEVFNFYEPLNYLLRHFGLQTWEYSPEYAIRSWTYIGLHAYSLKLVSYLSDIFGLGLTENTSQFYVLRFIFALTSASVEVALYQSLKRNVNVSIANLYILFSGISTGMLHASVSFLPSSFAMHIFTLALSQFLYFESVTSTIKGFTFIAIAGLMGWPFALVLAFPFGVYHLISCCASNQLSRLAKIVSWSAILSLLILGSITTIEYLAYGKITIVPLNIVLYNVINANDNSGPDIFGVEPWSYYVMNLILNFNILFPLSAISCVWILIPSNWIQFSVRMSKFQLLTLLSSFYLWLAIFIVQPHKEERFIYPVYSSLLVCAAVSSFYVIEGLSFLPNFKSISTVFNKVFVRWCLISVFTLLSLSRSLALYNNYHAPVTVFASAVFNLPKTESLTNICIGREWYRSPSSFFLPDSYRLKFIKSGFDGILPGEFMEPMSFSHEDAMKLTPWYSLWGNLEGTHKMTSNMNNVNREEPSHYIDLALCDYLIETSIDIGDRDYEVNIHSDPLIWEPVHCEKMLNPGQSKGIRRLLWLPMGVFEAKLSWNDWCLLKRHNPIEKIA